MILALLVIQGIGLVLLGAFAGFVISDLTRDQPMPDKQATVRLLALLSEPCHARLAAAHGQVNNAGELTC